MSRRESTPAVLAPPTPVRSAGPAFAALHHRAYRLYFVTSLLSMMGDNIEHVISYWVIFQAFHSPMLGGFAVISHWTPALLLSVYTGMLAERFDSRRIMQVSQGMFIAVSLTWGLLFLTGNLQVWHAVILLLVHGLAGSLWGPASQMIIHDMVGSQHLQSAVRLGASGRQLGILLGPAVGGALMLVLGPAVGLLVNVLLYLPLTAWLQGAPYSGRAPEGPGSAQRRVIRPWDGFQVLSQVTGDRTIITMVALAGLSSLLVGNAFQAQMPEYAHDLGTDRSGLSYSALLATNAAGALAAGLLLEGTGLLQARGRTAIVCAILWCLAIVGFAATRNYPAALALLFVAGFLHLAYSSMAQTLVQLRAPSYLRGRVIGLFNMSSQGLRVASGFTVGVLGNFIGVHWSLGLSAAALLAITLGLLAFVRRSDE